MTAPNEVHPHAHLTFGLRQAGGLFRRGPSSTPPRDPTTKPVR